MARLNPGHNGKGDSPANLEITEQEICLNPGHNGKGDSQLGPNWTAYEHVLILVIMERVIPSAVWFEEIQKQS